MPLCGQTTCAQTPIRSLQHVLRQQQHRHTIANQRKPSCNFRSNQLRVQLTSHKRPSRKPQPAPCPSIIASVDHRIPRHLTQIAANSGKPEGQPPPPLKKPTTLLQEQHKGALRTRVCKRLRQPEHETTASDGLTVSVTSYQRHCPGSVTCHHTGCSDTP